MKSQPSNQSTQAAQKTEQPMEQTTKQQSTAIATRFNNHNKLFFFHNQQQPQPTFFSALPLNSEWTRTCGLSDIRTTNTNVIWVTNPNQPQPTTTKPQPTTTNHNQPQPTTTNHNQPQPTTTNHHQPPPTTTNHNQPQPTTTNRNQPQSTTINHNQPQPTNPPTHPTNQPTNQATNRPTHVWFMRLISWAFDLPGIERRRNNLQTRPKDKSPNICFKSTPKMPRNLGPHRRSPRVFLE